MLTDIEEMRRQARVREIKELRSALFAPLSSAELKLVDKHCDWVAFGHAWNAIMKRRQATISNEQTPPKAESASGQTP